MLGNLDPSLRSRLENVHLVALFKSQLLETYSFNDILAPFIRDLKLLSNVSFPVTNYNFTYLYICSQESQLTKNIILWGFLLPFWVIHQLLTRQEASKRGFHLPFGSVATAWLQKMTYRPRLDTQTDRHTYRQTDGETDRQTYKFYFV